ncbi:MAG TPA: hypothetical protein VMD05_05850, partial [Candidatus Nanoarchaeia archaeon]|nr:hypothetical protein [Candidatus Nanoarchaeia archaeon]
LKMEIKTIHEKIAPAKIAETDLAYNLGRFGYHEFGRPSNNGKKICIEYITTALLLQDDIRFREAAPVILAKNNFNSNLLAFLSRKFGTAEDLMSILKILQELKPSKEIKRTIDFLSVFNTQETLTDKQGIEAKLRLYNAL